MSKSNYIECDLYNYKMSYDDSDHDTESEPDYDDTQNEGVECAETIVKTSFARDIARLPLIIELTLQP